MSSKSSYSMPPAPEPPAPPSGGGGRPRVFYAVYVGDRRLGTCLDAIRLLADPATRTKAHVTIRGPYTQRLRSVDEQRWTASLQGEVIRLAEPDAFFGPSQNTIYLRCEAPALQKMWSKRDYPDFRPHLTLYDGPSRAFADGLLRIITTREARYCIRSPRLAPLVSLRKPQRAQTTLGLGAELDTTYLSHLWKGDLPLTYAHCLSPEERLTAIQVIWNHLADVWGAKAQRAGASTEGGCADESDLAAAMR